MPPDADILSVLATEVGLDIYATEGVGPAHAAPSSARILPAAFRAALQDPDTTIFTARSGDGILGYARLLTAPGDPAHGTAELATLYIRRRHRRSGLGRALLQAALNRATEQGHRRLYLTVHPAYRNAIAFYAAQGFRARGEFMFDFEGTGVRNLVYAKDLSRDGSPPQA